MGVEPRVNFDPKAPKNHRHPTQFTPKQLVLVQVKIWPEIGVISIANNPISWAIGLDHDEWTKLDSLCGVFLTLGSDLHFVRCKQVSVLGLSHFFNVSVGLNMLPQNWTQQEIGGCPKIFSSSTLFTFRFLRNKRCSSAMLMWGAWSRGPLDFAW